MKSLDSLQAAWDWYQDTRLQLRIVERLARRYWAELPWDGPLGNDDLFRSFEGPELIEKADFSSQHLDDLAIVVLFSVFESMVRKHVLNEVEVEEPSIHHRAIKAAVMDIKEKISEGSFFDVLQPFKDMCADLVEEVNQVRRYRNWVAHGKRSEAPPNVDPRTAFERLGRFLAVLGPSSKTQESFQSP